MAGAPPPGGPPAKGGKLGEWVKKHKAVVIGGGVVGGVGVLYLLQKSGSGSGSAASSGTTGSTTADGTSAGPDPSVYSGGYGDGGSDSDYSDQMAALLAALSASTAASKTATATTAAASTAPTATKTAPPTSLQPGGPIKGKTPKVMSNPKTQTITVQPGQTLLSLSEKYFGTSNRTQLAHMNGLGTGAGLRAGQKLKV